MTGEEWDRQVIMQMAGGMPVVTAQLAVTHQFGPRPESPNGAAAQPPAAPAAGSKKEPAADVLARILHSKYFVAQTPMGEALAVSLDAPCAMIPMRGHKSLRQRLTADMFAFTGRTATQEALTGAVLMAEGLAGQGHQVVPHLRVARRDGTTIIDRGTTDGSTIAVGPWGWRVLDGKPGAPVLFARTPLTGELPVPVREGSIDRARDLVNVRGQDEWALYIACRIATLFPDVTHPIEVFLGQPGSLKTATTRLTKSWMDPSPMNVLAGVPRDPRTWATVCGKVYTVAVDNVSSVVIWWSDLLCKAASGDGWIDRALYTDGDIYVAAFQSVVILNGIEIGGLRGDFADRAVVHHLSPPAAGGYRSDDDVAAAWQAEHPAALGWLLDRAVEVMNDMRHVPAPGTGRLALLEQVITCVDRRWRTNAAGLLKHMRHDVYADVADADAVAVALRSAVEAPWQATSGELLSRLVSTGGLRDPDRGQWTPRGLSARVERVQGPLAALGWKVWPDVSPHTKRSVWNIVPPGWVHDGRAWVRG